MHSYLGIPIFDSRHKVFGHLAFKDDKKMENSILMNSVYQIFTARAGMELEPLEGQRVLIDVALGGDELPADERLRMIVNLLGK